MVSGSSHLMKPEYKENKLRKHLASKKVTDPLAIDLLLQLLDLDPKKRINAANAAAVRPHLITPNRH